MIFLLFLESDGTKKVFYLDRPLAPKQMTAVERNILFSLYAAKFQFSCGTAKMSYFYPGSVTQLDEVCDHCFWFLAF